MTERGWIEPIVERVVGNVLDSHVAELRSEIVRRVMEEISAEPAHSEPAAAQGASSTGVADLARAVAEIQLGSSQREILRALLDMTARYAARAALFVVKGSHATGWQARGFANSEGIKDFGLDGSATAVSHAIRDRAVAEAPVADFDSKFLQNFGSPVSGEGRIFPLILKDKVAALVYADAGTAESGVLDAGSLEVLVLSTSAWLEVNSLRKLAQKEPGVASAEGSNYAADAHASPAQSTPAPSTPAFNDPFASHAPAFSTGQAMAAAAASGEVSIPVASAAVESAAQGSSHSTETQSAVAEMEPELADSPVAGQADVRETGDTSAPSLSPEDQDVHRKAQRFARLLVDEIKLYNQAKVAEGRKNKDLYDRLKDTIEKSRATYHKRYGNTVAASAEYFQHEIIRSLAEDNLSIMGANFRH